MQQLTTTATFTDRRPDDDVLTTIVARSVLEAALAEDEKAELWFEIGREDEETTRLAIDLSASDLEEILRLSSGDDVALTLDGDGVAGLFDDPDVEAHGLKGAIAIAVTSAAILAPAGHAALPQSVGTASTAQRSGVAATAQIGVAATTQGSRVRCDDAGRQRSGQARQEPGSQAERAQVQAPAERSRALSGAEAATSRIGGSQGHPAAFRLARVRAMTAVRIDGKALAAKVRAQVAEDVRAYGEPVCLATILVGDDPASHVYVGSKHKASHEAGIESRDHRFPADTAESEILDLIDELNADGAVDGILVQLPLPEHMDEPKVLRAVDPEKDVDGFHVINAGLLYLGEPHFVPATRSGVMVMLAEHGVELKGKEASSSAAARSSVSRWRCCCSQSMRPSRSVTPERWISPPIRGAPTSSSPLSATPGS